MDATDPATLVENLDPDKIREQLAELDRQSAALRVLLRSALARQRGRAPRSPLPGKEARNAAS
jgi:hypothetical protein